MNVFINKIEKQSDGRDGVTERTNEPSQIPSNINLLMQ